MGSQLIAAVIASAVFLLIGGAPAYGADPTRTTRTAHSGDLTATRLRISG